MKMKKTLSVLGFMLSWIAVVILSLYWMRGTLHDGGTRKTEVETIRVTRMDTIRDTLPPIVRDRWLVRTDTILLDSLVMEDNKVQLPISQVVYSRDSSYTAWVSGYDAHLDSIKVYKTIVSDEIKKPPNRWQIGIQSGVGMTPKGVLPYVGIGISYRLTKN